MSDDKTKPPVVASILRWPVDPCWRIASPYGWRIHPVTQVKTFHSGIDIACPEGTPVKAPCAGKVWARWEDEKNGGGRSLKFKGEFWDDAGKVHELAVGFCHLLSYAEDVLKHPAKEREPGEILAFSGGVPGKPGSGRSTGAHLHVTVRLDGNLIDPLSVNWNVVIKGGAK